MTNKTFKKIILDDLKANGLANLAKKIKSITYDRFSMGDAVRIEAYDVFKSEREQLKTITDKYQKGHFNSMQDIYEYSNTKQNVERQAKFVTITYNFSDEAKEQAAAVLASKGITKDSAREVTGDDYSQLLHRAKYDLDSLGSVTCAKPVKIEFNKTDKLDILQSELELLISKGYTIESMIAALTIIVDKRKVV